MDRTLKKCNGTNDNTKGLGCGKPNLKRTYGLCRMCYIDWLINTESGKEHLNKSKIKGQKIVKEKKIKIEKAKFVKMKIEVTDFSKKLQDKVQLIARLIDKGLPCLATELYPNQMHGGHVYSKGSNQSMRYNLHNIHRQSAQSNHFHNDDIKMQEGLVREYGEGYLDFLKSCKQTPPLKFMKPDYEGFYRKACGLANDLIKLDATYTAEERIKERNRINIKIGIYRLKHSVYEL